MKTKDYLDFFALQIERATRGLDAARNTRNLQLATLNGRQLFKCHLTMGLVNWRQGDSPVRDLEHAIQAMQGVSAMARAWDQSFDAVANLPVARAALLSRLVGKERATEVNEWGAGPGLSPDVRLDLLLASELPIDEAVRSSAALISQLSATKKTALAAESYGNYFEILVCAADSERLQECSEKGHTLFLRRSRDTYYTGGDQSEGGGDDNARVVDYRLGFALRRAGYEGASMHAWKW